MGLIMTNNSDYIYDNYFATTKNKMGFAFKGINDDITKNFIEFSKLAKSPVLEIGAAYGAVTLEALKNGATVIANDIDEKHLEEIYNNCDLNLKKNLILIQNDYDNLNFLQDSLSAILCNRVIHFFDPEKTLRTIKKAYTWLEKGGKAFYTVETPYLKTFNMKKNLIKDFEERKKQGEQFPGFIKTKDYGEDEISNILPEYLNLSDDEVLKNTFESCGFQIEKCYMFAREFYPDKARLDNRESAGIIATKV